MHAQQSACRREDFQHTWQAAERRGARQLRQQGLPEVRPEKARDDHDRRRHARVRRRPEHADDGHRERDGDGARSDGEGEVRREACAGGRAARQGRVRSGEVLCRLPSCGEMRAREGRLGDAPSALPAAAVTIMSISDASITAPTISTPCLGGQPSGHTQSSVKSPAAETTGTLETTAPVLAAQGC